MWRIWLLRKADVIKYHILKRFLTFHWKTVSQIFLLLWHWCKIHYRRMRLGSEIDISPKDYEFYCSLESVSFFFHFLPPSLLFFLPSFSSVHFLNKHLYLFTSDTGKERSGENPNHLFLSFYYRSYIINVDIEFLWRKTFSWVWESRSSLFI